ncbi:MAG: response regulator transcription factor [Candidatus Rokuibacteriota bacterium]
MVTSPTVLVADDDRLARRLVEAALTAAGYAFVSMTDGAAARDALAAEGGPEVALLDWMMPGLSGPEVCRQVRRIPRPVSPYLILLTSRDGVPDIVAGLDAGADDYMVKPFRPEELRARVGVGARMVALQHDLLDRMTDLRDALAREHQLQGLLPICAYCKKIRNDQNYWQQVETYVGQHSAAQFTHSICPDCKQRVLAEISQMARDRRHA